jgi:ligand-binding sensor domain-containing protein/DNA-binding CsgD family transcriptional regulator
MFIMAADSRNLRLFAVKAQPAMMPGSIRHLFFLPALVFLFPFAGKGQFQHAPVAFDHLTTENGLSHSTVYTMLQDQTGLIWIGTRYGLNRYDGYECKVFLPVEGDSTSLNGPTVLAMMEDKSGKIWIGHREAGISVWDKSKGRFEPFPKDPDDEIDWKKISVRSLYEDSRGWLWAGTLGSGAFIFDEKRRKIAHLCLVCPTKTQALGNDFVFDFQEDHLGRVWIATDGQGLSVYDPATRTSSVIHSSDALDLNSYEKSLCPDRQGNLWIGTAGSGLYRYDLNRQQFEHFFFDKNTPPTGLSHNIVMDLALDSLGRLWIATDGGGLNIFDPASGQFQHITASPGYPMSLNTNALYHLLFDGTGNLWVGTFNGGVNIHKTFGPPFLIHENQNDYGRIGLKSVLALQEDDSGKIWIGTDGGGLFYASSKDRSIGLQAATAAGKRFPKPVITCLETAGNGGLWMGTYADGLSFFDTRTGAIRNFRHQPGDPATLSHNNVWSLELDRSGGLWIGTLGGGLDYLPPGSDVFKHFQPEFGNPHSLSSVQIVDVLLDKNGPYLWAASEDKGLNRLHIPTGEIRRYSSGSPNPAERLSGDNLQCLFQDKTGRIWIGTEFKGLDCIMPESGEILHFDTRHGLTSNMVNSITQDEQGHLWIGTQKGIVRFDPASRTFLDIGTDDNLKNNQYNPRASLRLKNGRLVFGGTNGFSILEPSRIHRNPHAPKTIFTDLRLSGQPVPIGTWNGRTVLNGNLNEPGTVVRLNYADRGIIFEFTGSDYTRPARNKFAYQLEGFDDDWNYTGPGQRRAIYSFLKGGAYLLRVKAANSDNVWGETSTLRIEVAPPFWETWWFYLLCLAAVLGVTFLIIRYFLEHQKAVFQEKTFKAGQEILRLQNENLEKEVEAKQARLSASVLQSAHKNKFLADLKTQVQKIELPGKEASQQELRRVVRAIDSEINQEDYWEQFQLTFNQMHQDFVHELQRRHPGISTNDVRLSCFIRMGFSNAEIASILNITVNGVEQSKYRLKKKMELDKDASLNEYIWQL